MIGKDKICAVVAAADAGVMWRQLTEAAKQSRTVELRLDWLSDDVQIRRFTSRLAQAPQGITMLATCRRKAGGGRYRGSIASQLVHLADAVANGCQWCDLEIESASLCPPELLDVLLGNAKRLVSAHFFKTMPANLEGLARKLSEGRPDGIKIAAKCDLLADWIKLSCFAKTRKDLIAIPMGDVALAARLLSLREPNGFAYAPVEHATAPGQISLHDIKQVYRGDRLTRRTQIYGVIGNPIGHSLSPLMQNAAFAARRIEAAYLPFPVGKLQDFINAIGPLGIRGFSITIPHKERILPFLDECDPLAAAIGAVNTVEVRDGKLRGYNTDYIGVLQSLERRVRLRGSRVLILGAGGAARAVAFALAQSGASVCISARRQKKALVIAQAIGGTLVDWNRLRYEFFDAIINATPVGMHPFEDESPLEAQDLNCRLVFDTIYRPQNTRLLQLAKRRGLDTVSGVEMFVAQGAAQWEIWTGKRAPVDVMRRVVTTALTREEKDKKKK